MIHLATPLDLSEIKNLTEICAKAMQEKGIFQWNEHYPCLERLKQDIHLEELFVLREEAEIIWIIVLTPEMNEKYIPIKWLRVYQRLGKIYFSRQSQHPFYYCEKIIG